MALAGTEIRPLRRKLHDRPMGHVFQRTFHVAPNNLDTIPARGSLFAGFDGGETSDVLKPRIASVKYVQQQQGAFQDVQITFFQPVILPGGMSTDNFKELRNSRRKEPGQFRNEAVILGVCCDDTHDDVPAKGDKFPGDESADLPRVCFSVISDPSIVPGLSFITAKYGGSVGA